MSGVAQPPAVALLAHDEARLDVFARGELEQRRARDRRRRVGDRAAHQQRLLLPVPAHETRRRQAPQQRRGQVDVHARDCAIIVRC
jgi:hypothetical protein